MSAKAPSVGPETENKPAPRDRAIDPETIRSLDLLDTREAAVYLRSSSSTLEKLRHFGGGPRFIRRSARRVLYRRTDLDAWLTEREHASTSEYDREAAR